MVLPATADQNTIIIYVKDRRDNWECWGVGGEKNKARSVNRLGGAQIDVCAIYAIHGGGTVPVGSKVENVLIVREESELIFDWLWLLNGSIYWAVEA